jgi:predicted Zn finger-like uncharacterized protein
MLTRCPACSTTFRVTPEQLKARSGRVRCGRCDHRFNALDALQEEAPVFIPASSGSPVAVPLAKPVVAPLPFEPDPIAAPIEAAAEVPDTQTLPMEAPPSLTETAQTPSVPVQEPTADPISLPEVSLPEVSLPDASVPQAEAEIRQSLAEFLLGKVESNSARPQSTLATPPSAAPPADDPVVAELTPLSELTPLTPATEPVSSVMEVPDPVAPAHEALVQQEEAAEPVDDPIAMPAAPAAGDLLAGSARPSRHATFDEWQGEDTLSARRWPWVIGVLLASLTLVAQAALHYRVELAVLQPQLKPWLVSACKAAGCTVSLPRKAEFLGIEASDLHPDPEHPGQLLLSATLKNRAPFAQEFPLLEVTLNDVADKPLTVRALPPQSYLPADVPRDKGFGINAEVAIKLTLDVSEMPAAGYRLYLFYP